MNDKNSSDSARSSNFSSEVLQQIDFPSALNPESELKLNGRYSPIMVAPGGSVEAMVAIAIAGAIAGVSQAFKKTEPRTDLNGSCIYGEPESLASSPCVNVTVNLLGTDEKILASSSTNQQGRFRFYIPFGQSYFVQVVDHRGRTSSTKSRLGRSEMIALFLKP